MGDLIIRRDPEIVLRYPVMVQMVSGCEVTMGQIPNSNDLLQQILDLKPSDAINIVLVTSHKADHSLRVAPTTAQVEHYRFEVDVGFGPVPCVYVARGD